MAGARAIPESRTGTRIGRSIAHALGHPFTVGYNAYTMIKRCPAKALHWMAVHRALAEKAGTFNPRYSPRGEDFDWYERLIVVGGRPVFDPSVVSHYYVRETYVAQFAVQVKNGFYRMQPFFESGRCVRLRHFAPVVAAAVLVLCCVVLQTPLVAAVAAGCYCTLVAIVALGIANGGMSDWPFVAWAIVLVHAGHLAGVSAGIACFGSRALAVRAAGIARDVGLTGRTRA